QDVVGPTQLEVLLAKSREFSLFLGLETRTSAGVDLGLFYPEAKRFTAHPELSSHPRDDVLVARVFALEFQNHAHRTFLQLRRIPRSCGPLLFHDPILSPKKESLRNTWTESLWAVP